MLLRSSAARIEVRPDPGRMQAGDVPVQVGSYERALQETGWAPEIPLDRTLHDLLEDWRMRIRGCNEASK
jgi:GDP-4-dehydro-6-deoxy-D-mannose reductase